VIPIRPLEPCDHSVVIALLRAALDRDPVSPALVTENLWCDPRVSALVWDSGEGPRGIIATVVSPTHRRGVVKLIAVDPARQGRGIGDALLHRAETDLAGRVTHIRLGESPPNYWWPGLDPAYSRALVFFERRGYRLIGRACHMRVDPTVLPVFDPLAAGIEIRRAGEGDRAELDQLLAAHWPAWSAEVAVGFENRPITVFVGRIEGRLRGFAAHDCNNRGTGWFGPMGTEPDARGSGLGRHLLHACLHDMAHQGHRSVIIPWVDPVHFYVRAANARIDRVFHRYQRDLPD